MQYRIELITRARVIRGWTQAELARAIAVDPSTISKIETRQLHGNPSTMKKIADVLNIPMEDFVEIAEATIRETA